MFRSKAALLSRSHWLHTSRWVQLGTNGTSSILFIVSIVRNISVCLQLLMNLSHSVNPLLWLIRFTASETTPVCWRSVIRPNHCPVTSSLLLYPASGFTSNTSCTLSCFFMKGHAGWKAHVRSYLATSVFLMSSVFNCTPPVMLSVMVLGQDPSFNKQIITSLIL